MAVSPLVSATLQSAILSATSNILAQAITAYRSEKSFIIDWVPVFQFFLFTVVSTPPNFLWQEFLEATFPAKTAATPTPEAIQSASANNEKELDREAREGRLVESKLNVRNTLAKFLLDQTVGAAVNTLLFSMFMHSIQAAMSHRTTGADASVSFLASGQALDYSQVNWRTVLEAAKVEFMPIMSAGWRLWPFVSLFNFVVVKSVEVRNLVGSLAGVVWGIYMSLVAAK